MRLQGFTTNRKYYIDSFRLLKQALGTVRLIRLRAIRFDHDGVRISSYMVSEAFK